MPLETFHPAVAQWFRGAFTAPTPAQAEAWPAIAAGRHTLIAAPTGSGKTLAAFLAAIDDLVRRGVERPLPDETAVVYVSPLKALSNDVRVNLEAPLAGIRDELLKLWLPDVEIRTCVRTGDTPQAERDRMRKRPPHIVVTTPESLYILLGSESGRRMLSTTRTVIVDEIHALAPNKRGAHLALSLERLDQLCERRLVRIGLSATQKPIDEVARFLCGVRSPPGRTWPGGPDAGSACQVGEAVQPCDALPSPQPLSREDRGSKPDCTIVDSGHIRPRDLAIELPEAPLEAVMSGDSWTQVYARLEALIAEHRTTLIFVNTRRMAERAARHLSERLGKDKVTAHHGSMAKEHRFDAEQRLKRGDLSALVATASLELGIDIGDVDLVCQIGSPRSIATFLQRVGRAGHQVDGTPKGGCFRSRATTWSNAPRCSMRCAAANSIPCMWSACRSTCSRSRSSPKSPAANGAKTTCSTWCAAHIRSPIWHASSSLRSCACSPMDSPRSAVRAVPICIAMRSTACCAQAAARA